MRCTCLLLTQSGHQVPFLPSSGGREVLGFTIRADMRAARVHHAARRRAAAWPLVARAQQPAMPVIGFLSGASFETMREYVAAFHRGLADAGFAEGRNVAIEYRWAEGHNDRLPALAMDLVRREVAVIVVVG